MKNNSRRRGDSDIQHVESRRLTIVRAVLLGLFMCVAHSSLADLQLLSLDSTWRYQQTTNLAAFNWQATGYDDSNWPTGLGLLYVENNPTISPRNTPLTIGRTTYYFRRLVPLPVEPTNMVISFSARIDDGAVFYVNGREVQRVRMPAPPALISYGTLATATPPGGDTTSPDVFSFSADALTNFVKGTNLIAVEVHQNAVNSDDVVFGTALTVKFTNSPPVLLDPPHDVTVVDGRTAFLAASVQGDPVPSLQWYKDGLAVPAATSSTLSFARTLPAEAGMYQLEATNQFGRLLSPAARLVVLADTNPPTVTAALGQKNLTNVQVSFSEAVELPGLTDTNNYAVFQTAIPSNRLRVLNAVAVGSTSVLLTTEPRTPQFNYSLQVQGIRDISSSRNTIPANSQFPLRYQLDLVAVDAQTGWNFSDGNPVPTNWASLDFVPTNWLSGAGVFAAGAPLPSSPDPVRTALPLNATNGAFSAYYFRTAFDLPGPVDTNSLRMRDIADDGAVFYLNGSEVFSVGMAATRPVSYTNRAIRTLSQPASYEPSLPSSPWTIPGPNLLQQGNVFAAEIHQAPSGFADAAFAAFLEAVVSAFYPRLELVLAASVSEGAGIVRGQGSLTLLEPLATNLVVRLVSSNPDDVEVPGEVTIMSGTTNANFDLTVGDNAVIDGPRLVTLTAQSAGIPSASGVVQVLDNETNAVTVTLPATTSETNGTVMGEVRLARPAVLSLPVALNSSDPSEVVVPASVMMPAGATSIVFQATIMDDLLLDGSQSVSVTASVSGWALGATTISVEDNETATLALVLPATIVESGILTNAGRVSLGGMAGSNVVVSLECSAPASLSIPSTVTVLAGQSNAVFTLTAPDDFVLETNLGAQVTAAAAGFSSVTNGITVLDNDPHHVRFGAIPQLVDTNSPFSLELVAENADGSIQTNFNLSLTLLAAGVEGTLAVQPTNTGAFSGGRKTVSVVLPAPGRAVRLSCLEYSGQSEPFNCVPPVLLSLTQRVADIVWHEASQTLFASVPASAATYSNKLVAIDLATGLVTNSYPVDLDPSQVEISPDGTYLYIAISNRAFLQRFDLGTRTARPKFALGAGISPLKFASDFCVPPGLADSAVVALREMNEMGSVSAATIWRYSSGAPVALQGLTASGGWQLESLAGANQVLLTPPLIRGNASSGGVLQTGTNFAGNSATYRDGSIYDTGGNCYSANSFTLLGSFPGVMERAYDTSIVDVNPALRRVFYLAGYFNYGSSFYKLKVYDRDLRHLLMQMPIPGAPGSPTRILRCANQLAYTTGDGQLWFIQPDAVQPVTPPAELALGLSDLPAVAVVGSNYTFSLILSNGGPGIASTLRVTNSFPANTLLVATKPSAGILNASASGFNWYLGAVPPGSNAILQVTLQFNTAGWQTNTTWALGFEPDPIWTNSLAVLPLNVQLPEAGTGAFAVNCASEDLLYDPARDRLLLSVGSTPQGQLTNGIAVFNPYNGLTESFTSLGKKPGRLARTDGGQYLYVSLPEDALVRRLTLPGLAKNLEFSLGAEDIYGTPYPFFAADLLTLPGEPENLIAWRVRRAGPMASEFGRGIALFQGGVMSSNVTQSGGAYDLELDSDSGTLYAFNAGSDYYNDQGLYRCTFGPSGVTNSSLLLPEYSFPGQAIKYARGRMFSTAGRVARLEPPTLDWFYPGSETASLVRPDAASGRVFFLIQTNGWRIKAYDLEQGFLLGTIPIQNLQGTPGSLVSFGTNGLAFRTSSNQLFVIRSPLFQQATADLTLALSGPAAPVEAGNNAAFTLTVTNHGPNPAAGVQITNAFSRGVTFASASASLGTFATNAGTLVWTLPALDAGARAVFSYSFSVATTGVLTVTATAAATPTPDPRPGNNTAVQTLVVGTAPAADMLALLQVSANDLVWSPSLAKLLLTSTTNTPNWGGALLSMDPTTLAVEFKSILGTDAGRLAISSDDSVVYAGVDYGISASTIPDLAQTNRFLINPSDPRAFACELEVAPGSARTVLAGSRTRGSNLTWLGIYDGGNPRTNVPSFNTTGFSLEFGNDPSLFYYQDHNYGGFSRYAVDAGGITLLETINNLLPNAKPIELEWADGLLYTSLGMVIDPVTRQLLRTIPGITNNSPLCFDNATKRLFLLMPAGSNAILNTIDARTAVVLDSRLVSGFTGTPAGLVRWGTDGLAFRTSSGQIGVLHSSLVPSGPAVDLQVGLVAPEPLAFVGSNFVYSIAITNAGLNSASNAQVTVMVPANVSVAAALASQGSATTGPQQALASLGTLAPGATAQVLVTVVPSQPGSLVAVASATSGALDSDWTNNSARLTNSAALFVARDSIAVLQQSAADLVFNPASGRLYASDKAGAIAVIYPPFAQVETNWLVPTQPGRLALSSDGQALYVSHDSGKQLARLQTANGYIATNFSLGSINAGSPLTLLDMEVIPGAAGSVVVNETDGGYHYLAVMDDGVARTNRPFLPSPSNGSYLEFGDDPSVVYLSGLMPVRIVSNGISVTPAGELFPLYMNFKYDRGLFFTDAGHQVDPTNRFAATRFADLGPTSMVVPETSQQRVYALTRVGATWQVRAYDSVTAEIIGTQAVTNVAGTPSAFLRWGDDGLAFCTTSNQVFLLRPWFVPGGADADLQVAQIAVPAGPVDIGSNVTFTAQLTNAGPASAANVQLSARVPTNATLVQVQLSQGTSTFTNGLLTCALGTLTNRGSAQLTLTLRAARAGALLSRVAATSANVDPNPGNNLAATTVGVRLNLAADGAGIVDLQTGDIEYDPISGLIYASLTNYSGPPYEEAIVTINPATGVLGPPIQVGPQLSRIAVTDDGSALYALTRNGRQFSRLRLPDGTATLSVPFSAATGQAESAANDILAVPGQRDSMAVILGYPGLLSDGTPALVAYDDAVPRPRTLMWQDTAEFFAANFLMVRSARVQLTNDGFVAQASAGGLVDGTMAADAGLIYTSAGSAFDPMTMTKLRSFGAMGPVAPDHTVNRVCFLGGTWYTRVLRVFDQRGLRELPSLTITNVTGSVERLIRCGADRLAFRTSNGAVYILRTSSIPTGPAADLAVGLLNPETTPTVGQPLSLLVTVTNCGPASCPSVVVSNSVPATMTLVSATPSTGSVTGVAPSIIWNVGSLAVGEVATNRLVLLPRQAGALAAQCVVWDNGITDVNGANDAADTTWLVHGPTSPPALSSLTLAAGDMIWEPNSRRLLLTAQWPSPAVSNCLLSLDPIGGRFDRPIPVGSNPGRLVASDNGQFVYIGMAGSSLARLQLPDGVVQTNYQVPGVLDLQLAPAVPHLFVLRGEYDLYAYLDGVMLPFSRNIQWDYPLTMTRPNAAGRFYGYQGINLAAYVTPLFYRLTVNSTGMVVNDATQGLITGADTTIEYANGLVFASSGTVLGPETLTVVTNIPDLSSSSLVRPDPGSGLLNFVTPKSGEWWLRQYSHTNYGLLREFRLPLVRGTPKSLVRWGADGLAFLTTSNQVYLLRPSLAFADVDVSHAAWPAEVIAGQPFQVTLTFTNQGSSFAADAFVTNAIPAYTRLVQANSSQGTVTITNNLILFALGDVPANSSLTLSVTLIATNSTDLTVTNACSASSAFADLQPGNNSSMVSFSARADEDRDGMPDYWERAHGLMPSNPADALLDPDGDGTTNLQEFLAGTDPLVPDTMHIVSARPAPNGQFELMVQAPAGIGCFLQDSTNMEDWRALAYFMAGGTNQVLAVPRPTGATQFFYRLMRTNNPPQH